MGPLQGIKVVEFAGLGPGPFCAMLFADMGAEVVRIARPADMRPPDDDSHRHAVLNRGRRSVVLDLKHPDGCDAAMRFIERADVLIEGFRPGVMERLGLGPETCHARNPGLVYGRITGWGQDGPVARAAGHDINYLALSGSLWPIGRAGEAPVVPLNLVADFGGGAMYLAFGIVSALVERGRSGIGQVVDAAMVDGAASLAALIYGLRSAGRWVDRRGDNLVDGAAPWYTVYETADGEHVAVGAVEPHFYAELIERLGIDPATLPNRNDRAAWPVIRERFAAVFKSRARSEWCERLEGTDACFTPVLSPAEAYLHPHMRERETFQEVDGVLQPAPAPRFSRTIPERPQKPRPAGADTVECLRETGYMDEEIETLLTRGRAVQRGRNVIP